MAPPTRRRTRATANSSPLVELKSEPKRRITRTKAKRPVRAPEPARTPEPEPEQTARSEEISGSKLPFSLLEAPLSVASFLTNPPSVLRDIHDLVKSLLAEIEELKKNELKKNDPKKNEPKKNEPKKNEPKKHAQEADIAPQAGIAPKDKVASPEAPSQPAPVLEEEDRSEALALLRLADLKREQNMALSRIDVLPVELSPPALSPVHATPQPPSTPRTNGATPHPTTPQSSASFLGSMWSTLKSWSTPKPKSARPSSNTNTPIASAASTPIAPLVIGELTMTLTPTPTPVGDSRGSSKLKRPAGRRERAAIIRNVASSVPDAAEEELATKWAEKVLMQLLQDSSASTGDKRKRLEDGMTYGDLNHFNSKPWKPAASSFGLDNELADHVDDTPDELAPMWAVLEHLRIEQQWNGKQAEQEYESSPPSAKKRKVSMSGDSIASPTQSTFATDYARSPFYNSGGRSTSLLDLHPRSCLDRPISSSQDSNIFKQSQQTAAQHNNTSETFPTSFSVPDDSSDDEDDDEEPNNGTPTASTTWTQPPPPAPVMPHAELPGSVGLTPSVPSVEGHLVASPTVARVEAQRAKALKFTPAKPSNLSHMSKPSPSLRSDAGNESILADTPVPMFRGQAPGAAAPNIFQSANMSNGASLFQNKTPSKGATPAQDDSLSNGTSIFQDKSLGNGSSIFQDKSLGSGTSIFQEEGLNNGASPFQSTGLNNGTSLFQSTTVNNSVSPFQSNGITNGSSTFQNKGLSNGASPFQSTGITNGDSPFQTKSLDNGTFAVKSAGASLALPDYELAPPDAEPLDLPFDIETDLATYVPSAEFQAKLDSLAVWEDPILEFSDDEL